MSAERLLCLLLLLNTAAVYAAGFEVVWAQTRLVDGVYLLDADIDYELSAAAQEALTNSVPLTLSLRMQVLRARGLLWDQALADLSQRFRLKYHALAQQYIVTNLNNDALHSFPTRRSALDFIGRLRDFPLLDRGLLPAGEEHYVRIRAELDIESLPAPLRPLAYFSPNWRLASAWLQWPL